MPNNVGSFLSKRAHLDPDLEAVVESDTGRRFTYSDLNRRANRAAHTFLGKGIEKGDRVAFMVRNGVEFVESFFQKHVLKERFPGPAPE